MSTYRAHRAVMSSKFMETFVNFHAELQSNERESAEIQNGYKTQITKLEEEIASQRVDYKQLVDVLSSQKDIVSELKAEKSKTAWLTMENARLLLRLQMLENKVQKDSSSPEKVHIKALS